MLASIDNVQAGDIVGFLGADWSSIGIGLVTRGLPFWPFYWSLSHVGIVGEYNGQRLLFESTTLNDLPCVIRGEKIAGSQAQHLTDRVASYQGRIWHYPLISPLYDDERTRLNQFLLIHIGVPYDKIAAFLASRDLQIFNLLESCHHVNEASVCSLLAASAHSFVGRFRTEDVRRWNPNCFVRTERTQGILADPQRLK